MGFLVAEGFFPPSYILSKVLKFSTKACRGKMLLSSNTALSLIIRPLRGSNDLRHRQVSNKREGYWVSLVCMGVEMDTKHPGNSPSLPKPTTQIGDKTEDTLRVLICTCDPGLILQ